ncbi:MAG: XdhC family protein [Pyrinomonadaceae bacterium]|nr:XdhC family protein [Pyrinomonadaceae bacterium]
MWSDILDQAGRLRDEEQPFVLATVVAYKSPQSAKPGSKAIIRADGTVTGWVGGGCVQPIVLREAKKVLASGKPKLLSISPEAAHEDWKGVESYRMTCEGGGSLEIYLEPVVPKPELLIVGRSPVAQIVSELGRLLDFKVCLADPQANQEQFTNVDLILTDLSLVRSHINEKSFVVVATMGNGDEEGLQAVVGSNPRYLGLVASKKKATSLFEYVRDKGATDEEIGRIKCPAGLELGGETLPEIALSVMAEITQVRREKSEPAARSVTLPVMQGDSAGQLQAFDPICGMVVDTENARYTSVVDSKTFYFCCIRCKETFDNPQISQIT